MKTLDKLLVNSFIPPFIVTFFIALFVLIMQFLWTYIDDIVGKGVSFFMMLELLFYLSISLIPTALPIAILISSVMLMGNLAERYELASFKSAGIPLLRVMQPLMFVTLGISFFSYTTSNNLIPISNLQFKSRLYDIRKQKPALALETGVFNDDFRNFIIHIGDKKQDNKSISDVLIYDHNNYNRGKATMILADEGEMYTTQDKRFFVMNLQSGTQYQETKQTVSGKDKTYPFIRTSFEEWTKVFDLSEFEINETQQELFKSHHSMLSSSQLRTAIDSIDIKIEDRKNRLTEHISKHFFYLKKKLPKKEVNKPTELTPADMDSIASAGVPGPKTVDKKEAEKKKKEAQKKKKTPKKTKTVKKKTVKKQTNKKKPKSKKKPKKKKKKNKIQNVQIKLDKPIAEYAGFHETLIPKDKIRFLNRAKSSARSIHGQSDTALSTTNRQRETRVKHVFELNIKFSMAFACFIFLFIGAPMGAIVRKGGFGYPILIAIIFFMLYIVMNIFCKKLATSFVLPSVIAAWLPCMILFPIGLILTYRAMNDSKVLNTDRYARWWHRFLVLIKLKPA